MIWPVIDPINASTKSSSKLTAATQLVKYILVVGDRKGPLIQRLSMRGIFIGSRIVSFPRIIPIRKKQSLSLSRSTHRPRFSLTKLCSRRTMSNIRARTKNKKCFVSSRSRVEGFDDERDGKVGGYFEGISKAWWKGGGVRRGIVKSWRSEGRLKRMAGGDGLMPRCRAIGYRLFH